MPKTDFSVLKKWKRHCDVPYHQEYEELHKILCHSIYALKYIQHVIIMGKYACSLSFFKCDLGIFNLKRISRVTQSPFTKNCTKLNYHFENRVCHRNPH